MTTFNKVCFTICSVSVVLAVLMGMAMIWTDIDPQVSGRLMATLALLCVGSAGMCGIRAAFGLEKKQ